MFKPKMKNVEINNESEDYVILLLGILGTLVKRSGERLELPMDEVSNFLSKDADLLVTLDGENVVVYYQGQPKKVIEA